MPVGRRIRPCKVFVISLYAGGYTTIKIQVSVGQIIAFSQSRIVAVARAIQ